MTTPTALFVSFCFVGGLGMSGWMTVADHGVTGIMFAILTMVVVVMMIAADHNKTTSEKIKDGLKDQKKEN